MIIDDGVKARGHRNNLFGVNYVKIGIASGSHKTYQHFTVVDFFGNVENTQLSFDKYQIEKDQWPENAISLSKHIEAKTNNKKKTIYLTYTFTMSDGSKEVRKKEFVEEL